MPDTNITQPNDPVTFDRQELRGWIEAVFKAACNEHGSNDEEHDVLFEMLEMVSTKLGDVENEHQDC